MANDISPELAFAIAKLAEKDSNGNPLPEHGEHAGVLHVWTGTYWKAIEPEDLERDAFDWLSNNMPEKATPRTANSCAVAVIMRAKRVPDRDDKKVLIPTTAGTVELASGGTLIRSARKEDGLCYIVDCDFDPFVKSPIFTDFLSAVLPDVDVQNYVQEYIGYTLLPDTRFEKSLFFTGGGSNGKTTLARIVARLHRKVAGMELDNLTGFALTGLVGASLVVVDETPKRINEQALKRIISGNFISIERKYRDPLTISCTAKWLINGNTVPAISDQTNGFWRRFSIVEFNRNFEEHERDVMLADKVIENELSGVLNWAIEGLQRLMSRGRFPTLPEAMQRARDNGKTMTNTVLAFIQDQELKYEESAQTDKSEIYMAYQNWCRDNGNSPVNSATFWTRMREQFKNMSEVQRRIDGRRVRCVNIHFH